MSTNKVILLLLLLPSALWLPLYCLDLEAQVPNVLGLLRQLIPVHLLLSLVSTPLFFVVSSDKFRRSTILWASVLSFVSSLSLELYVLQVGNHQDKLSLEGAFGKALFLSCTYLVALIVVYLLLKLTIKPKSNLDML